ncbi:MAG: septum formation protein Maf [Chloroflexi bacterium]|nr:septum formation protein Maf [Chloroflexota bacterium]MBI4504111.1 septum formation protein Maf [Chloroflexota bacterium]
MAQRVVLASASPRRSELLALLGLPFRVVAAEVDERPRRGEAGRALARRLARAKALAVVPDADELVLAADTVVLLGGAILGKPADEAEATAMLRRLRGRRHEVYTAVAGRGATGRLVERGVASQVWLRALSDAEIADYVASGDPLDKAGAYAVQSQAYALVHRLVGCYANVVGLPLCATGETLAALGAHTGARAVCYEMLGHDVVVPREPAGLALGGAVQRAGGADRREEEQRV